ncbi:cupredoxin domain-containing protein [Nonomuraea sp. NPDC050383]|uniref:cupredoxin domain-containing protein n=1 Tax=Nonomuraea sp. NPDC050383 TaxID=3364362 RepID=UPI0037A1E492
MGGSSRRRGPARLAAAAAAVLLGLAGCGGSHAWSAAPSRSPVPATAAAEVTTVDVTMDDFSFTLPRHDLTSGSYTFRLSNEGESPHAMAIAGPGISGARRSATITPGQRTFLTVTLRPGRYEVWCPVDDHRALGMDTAFDVR